MPVKDFRPRRWNGRNQFLKEKGRDDSEASMLNEPGPLATV